jgi:hypothetical protein
MAEDIRISVDTARFRRSVASQRTSRFVLLRDALPLVILGFALLVYVAV